jgi:hypothetical protein
MGEENIEPLSIEPLPAIDQAPSFGMDFAAVEMKMLSAMAVPSDMLVGVDEAKPKSDHTALCVTGVQTGRVYGASCLQEAAKVWRKMTQLEDAALRYRLRSGLHYELSKKVALATGIPIVTAMQADPKPKTVTPEGVKTLDRYGVALVTKGDQSGT